MSTRDLMPHVRLRGVLPGLLALPLTLGLSATSLNAQPAESEAAGSDTPPAESESTELPSEGEASEPPPDDTAEAATEAAAPQPEQDSHSKHKQPPPLADPPWQPTREELPPLLPSRFTAQLFWDWVWNTDPGYDLFSDSDVNTRFGIALAYDVLRFDPDLVLAAELGFSLDGVSRDDLDPAVFNRAWLASAHLHAGVILRYALLPWFVPHARLRAGLSLIETEIEFLQGNNIYQKDTLPYGVLGAGFSFQTTGSRIGKQHHAVHAGISFEGGYLVTPALSFAVPDRSPDGTEQRLAVRGAPLGELDRSGGLFHTALFVRF